MVNMDTIDKLLTRRNALGLMGGAALAAVVSACGGGSSTASSSRTTSTSTTTTTTPSTSTSTATSNADTTTCTLTPQETAGPYPLDLHNNPAMFRKDITEGKTGVPLALTLTMLNTNKDCAPITNARIDVWHCDKDGVYSGYSQAGANTVGETFCRGIQLTDRDGKVTFTTIYPGWYRGRITHIHFQLYLNNGLVATSQLAFPQDITTAVYDSALYKAHGQNTSVSSFSQDNVFSDGTTGEMLTLTGDASSGYTATLTAGVAV
jgi:protocatechuate 3,4-dioxygenase beta subunit